eukprot:TRINITY_DN11015_c0_g1_i1.p1 TRINITY_DN11015_c0_g1~~TRINITY_DN11015_c0_g1_i1.p1  ORF type:complete len:261 (-),score=67.01 TRINITY_DN11015_c0_g1_i1:52-834(-)
MHKTRNFSKWIKNASETDLEEALESIQAGLDARNPARKRKSEAHLEHDNVKVATSNQKKKNVHSAFYNKLTSSSKFANLMPGAHQTMKKFFAEKVWTLGIAKKDKQCMLNDFDIGFSTDREVDVDGFVLNLNFSKGKRLDDGVVRYVETRFMADGDDLMFEIYKEGAGWGDDELQVDKSCGEAADDLFKRANVIEDDDESGPPSRVARAVFMITLFGPNLLDDYYGEVRSMVVEWIEKSLSIDLDKWVDSSILRGVGDEE